MIVTDDASAKTMLATNAADLAFIAGPPTTSDMALYPDMYAYPLLASGNGYVRFDLVYVHSTAQIC